MSDERLRELERVAKTTRSHQDLEAYAMALKRAKKTTRQVYRIINSKGKHLSSYALNLIAPNASNYYLQSKLSNFFTTSSGLKFSSITDLHKFVFSLNKFRPDILKDCKVIEIFNIALDVSSNMEEFLDEAKKAMAEEKKKEKEKKLNELKTGRTQKEHAKSCKRPNKMCYVCNGTGKRQNILGEYKKCNCTLKSRPCSYCDKGVPHRDCD